MLLSRGWLARYVATDAPGPVTHSDVLCAHDAVDAYKAERSVDASYACFVYVPRAVWSELTTRYVQTQPAATPILRLTECRHCDARRKAEAQDLLAEREEISKLDSTALSDGERWYIVEASWLRHWREYCWDATRTDPPGPISNWRLLAGKQPRPNLVRARDYRGVNYKVWRVFVHRYGGGPAICRYELDMYAPPAPPQPLT